MKTDTETDINLVSVPLFKDKFLDWEGLIGRGLMGDLEKFNICFDICDTDNDKTFKNGLFEITDIKSDINQYLDIKTDTE